MSDFDTGPVLEKSIEAVTADLGTFSDEQLQQLHDAESEASKPRSGMLKAIHAELAARDATKREKEVLEFAESKGVRVFTGDEVEILMADHGERIQSLEAALVARDGATPAKASDAQPRTLSVTGDAEAPFIKIAFTGDDDVTLADLPELDFGPGAFTFDRTRKMVTLDQPIVFPEAARKTEVAKVWLIGANGKAAAVSSMVTPLSVGGGTRATIPAGHLAFHGIDRAGSD